MDLERLIFGCRGLRISCWIVGIEVLSPFSSHMCARGRPPCGFNSSQARPPDPEGAGAPHSTAHHECAISLMRVSQFFVARETQCEKPQRFRTEVNDAVGSQRIGSALDRIVSTSVLISTRRAWPCRRDERRIEGVGRRVNSPIWTCLDAVALRQSSLRSPQKRHP